MVPEACDQPPKSPSPCHGFCCPRLSTIVFLTPPKPPSPVTKHGARCFFLGPLGCPIIGPVLVSDHHWCVFFFRSWGGGRCSGGRSSKGEMKKEKMSQSLESEYKKALMCSFYPRGIFARFARVSKGMVGGDRFVEWGVNLLRAWSGPPPDPPFSCTPVPWLFVRHPPRSSEASPKGLLLNPIFLRPRYLLPPNFVVDSFPSCLPPPPDCLPELGPLEGLF